MLAARERRLTPSIEWRRPATPLARLARWCAQARLGLVLLGQKARLHAMHQITSIDLVVHGTPALAWPIGRTRTCIARCNQTRRQRCDLAVGFDQLVS
jgi:hypothetical protein